MPLVPPRLHVLLAREADTAVVFRRGPTNHTAVVGWDRKTDEFQVGQWLKGRIYEERSDLSPDGKHLIYFAKNMRRHSETGGTWTAISRAPYLKALTLLGKGDCWHGGGLFEDSQTYWLNEVYAHREIRDESNLRRTVEYPGDKYNGGKPLDIYYLRLIRDGWVMRTIERAYDSPVVFDKPIDDYWTLRKLAWSRSSAHQLIGSKGELIEHPAWGWADIDRGRLVWASNGCLFAAKLAADGTFNKKLLFDFGGIQFERLAAPY